MTTLTSRTFTAASDREAVSYVAALREGEQVALYATGATDEEGQPEYRIAILDVSGNLDNPDAAAAAQPGERLVSVH